ncbi:hypothetical protein CYQ88_05250 [Hydrogenovibrio sp. SC-1]|uniref:GGDEF domain-containing protein n=1 Tax=Hydrogenovibrio sp. SC-1 TaxID=2065820 RepID=UPI000C7A8EF8|nr:GGDEF domain-containing protein [Hydrogenovibrio sp. SC-1]PLA74489.1 hypothetical protein CYQ88_05250 [Hydrogenovibrio sp. SC-1]
MDKKKLEHAKRIERLITRRYLTAVLIIALLSTGAFVALKSALNDSDSTALVVNISGKQRMLSQHIALDVHRIHRERFRNDYSENLYYINSIRSRVAEMVAANKRLSSGSLAENQVMPLSEIVRDMYFGEMNLSQRVNDYTHLALKIIAAETFDQSEKVIEQIDQVSEGLLVDLNKVVFQYQKEGEDRLELISDMETFLLLFTLFTLMLEVLFIFRPMAKSVLNAEKKVSEVLNSLKDQVELRTIKLEQANQKLLEAASHDPLTGVKNRLTMEEDVGDTIQAFKSHQQDFGLVMLDIDWFKSVNDQYGHDFGDAVLVEFAYILEQHVRSSDQVYRAGGEEFVLLMNRISLKELMKRMKSLGDYIQSHSFKSKGKVINVSASMGVFHSSLLSGFDFQLALKLADSALYEAKSLGRKQVVLAHSDKSS